MTTTAGCTGQNRYDRRCHRAVHQALHATAHSKPDDAPPQHKSLPPEPGKASPAAARDRAAQPTAVAVARGRASHYCTAISAAPPHAQGLRTTRETRETGGPPPPPLAPGHIPAASSGGDGVREGRWVRPRRQLGLGNHPSGGDAGVVFLQLYFFKISNSVIFFIKV